MRSRGEGKAPLRPAEWGVLEAVPLFLLALVPTILVGGLAGPHRSAESGRLVYGVLSCPAFSTVVAVAGEVGFFAVALLWVRIVNHAPASQLGLMVPSRSDVLVGALAGAGLFAFGIGLAELITVVVTAIIGHQPASPDQVDPCVRGMWFALTGPVVVLLAPLGEETFFRGFLYRGLRRRLSVWPAALVSGALFGLIHFQGWSFLLIVPSLVMVGVGLALVFEYRQSLVASMTAHATFNLFGYALIALGRR
jgi:membrane protease YdiL (CAAX protease family)